MATKKEQAAQTTQVTPAAPVEPARVSAKPGELKELFVEYESANAHVNKASEAYDKAMANRSAIVERFSAFGKVFTSPTGQQLQVASRANGETGVKSFYFRGTKEAPQKIE